MSDVSKLKPILYEILISATCESNQTDFSKLIASQNMNLNLSNTVKRENGINVFQMQSIKFETIIPKLVQALQIVDKIDLEQRLLDDQKEVTIEISEEKDPIDEFIKYVYDNKFQMSYITDLIKVKLYNFMLKKIHDKNAILEQMNLSKASIYTAKKRLEQREDRNAYSETK